MIAILGGGIAGLTAAWQLHQSGTPFTLFEATGRLGGTIETVHREGFLIELGPDGWVTEKPWAAELARDLNLSHELIASNDATRVTYILQDGKLLAMPDGMRMMVPTDIATLSSSELFSQEAIAAYTAEPARSHELRAQAPDSDESIAAFTARHFGPEVLHKVAAPLLSGVFGGNVETLSIRAVMPSFVQMEHDHGSLITALQAVIAQRGNRPAQPIFTTLRTGVQTLIDTMAAQLAPQSIRLNTPVESLRREGTRWHLTTATGEQAVDHLIVATPAHITHRLLDATVPEVTALLPLEASSAILVAFAFLEHFPLPQGFGFLSPERESALLAATFVDGKYNGRVPPGGRLLRAFFGGSHEQPHDARTDEELTTLAFTELERILSAWSGPLPEPAFTLVRRWPRSLPQYAVGHLDRIAQLEARLAATSTLHLLGNPYRGVGLPDLIRDARALARKLAT